jgi:hypothetical protein
MAKCGRCGNCPPTVMIRDYTKSDRQLITTIKICNKCLPKVVNTYTHKEYLLCISQLPALRAVEVRT